MNGKTSSSVPATADDSVRVLKSDELGRVLVCRHQDQWAICRDIGPARWWARAFARRAAAREARVLERLSGLDGVPQLLSWDGKRLWRSYIDGAPMQEAMPRGRDYYRKAQRLLARLHRRNVVHNDLAKEPNWLVTTDGDPALIDFQLAWRRPRRGRLFRLLAREDIRHLLKHKRTYCPQALSARQREILATPAAHSRLWRATFKRLYKLVARRLFGYWDNEGRGRIRDGAGKDPE